MSHSSIPPQGPNPFGAGGTEPPRRDYGGRQALLVIIAIVGMLVFSLVIIGIVQASRSDSDTDDDIYCDETTGGLFDDETTDGFDFGETDDYDFDDGITDEC